MSATANSKQQKESNKEKASNISLSSGANKNSQNFQKSLLSSAQANAKDADRSLGQKGIDDFPDISSNFLGGGPENRPGQRNQ